MNYNNYFPQSYVAQNPQYFQSVNNQTYPQMQQTPQSSMTLPTVQAEIVQVENEEAAANFPVALGETRMMMAKDDSAFFVKSAYPNGQYSFDVFEKRQPKKREDIFSNYITREEFENRIAALMTSNEGVKNEPV